MGVRRRQEEETRKLTQTTEVTVYYKDARPSLRSPNSLVTQKLIEKNKISLS
jgi:hypothetical protein